jgi:hypothetical protein
LQNEIYVLLNNICYEKKVIINPHCSFTIKKQEICIKKYYQREVVKNISLPLVIMRYSFDAKKVFNRGKKVFGNTLNRIKRLDEMANRFDKYSKK